MATERNYLISTTGVSTTASGTTIGSGNTQDAAYVVARTMVRTGVPAATFLATSQTWAIHYVVSAMTTPYSMRLKLQRRNSSGTMQTESGYATARTATGTYDDNLTWTSGTWAANDQLAVVWEHFRPSGSGNKNATMDANGASYVDAPIPVVAPTVTTQAVSSITKTTATGNGNVTADGGDTITERGVCWNTTGTPTTSDSKATSAGTTGVFTASITSLTASTHYYVRAYAINSIGTSYGSQVEFDTQANFTASPMIAMMGQAGGLI